MKKGIIAGLAALLASQSYAAQADWYALAEVGQAKSQTSSIDIDNALKQQNINAEVSYLDEKATAWSLQLGYSLSSWLAVELGYMDLGEREVVITGQGNNLVQFYSQVSEVIPSSGEGFTLALASSMPVYNDALSVTGRVGVFDWQNDHFSFPVSGNSSTLANATDVDDSGVDVWASVAVNYDLDEEWAISLAYRHISLKQDDNDALSLGLKYRF